MNNKIAREFSHKLIMEELEARQLFSDGIEAVVAQELPPPQPATYIDIDSTSNSTAQSGDTANVSNPVQDGVRQELVFVDTDVKNYQELLNDIYNQSDAERNIQVILLDNNSDGIQQITQALSQYNNLDAVHLISHGSDGSIDIGNSPFNFESLSLNQETISAWGKSFTENGDILIYGCNVAETQSGQNFIGYLSSLTHTDVTASSDATGNSSLGGDWTLEFSTGSIETAVAPSADAQASWQGILATTTFQEGVSGYTGTTDTYLDSTLSGTNYGASGTLQIITPLLLGSTQQSLISFDLSSALIPVGAIVTSASVTFTASSAIAVLPSVDMYKMLSSWSESTSTWSSLGSGVSTDNSEASSTADASWGALLGLNGTATFSSASMASTVQSWINNPASNNGWLLTAGITSVQFYSSEAATIAYRPQLSITYTLPTPPSMDLDANNSSGAAGSNYTTSFTEGGAAVNIADIDAIVTAGSNSISPNLSGMTVTISNLLDGTAESLAATTSGTSITASYNAGVLTLSGSDTAANYQTVLRTVTYNNTSNAPNTTNRVINVVATDPYGGSSTAVSTTIAITAVNDAPTATNLSAAQSYTEDTPLALTGIVISDVDSVNVTATLTLSDAAVGSLNTGTAGAVTSSFAAGVWSASGAIADVNALLAGLTFTPALNANSTFSIATSVSDGIAPAVTGSKTITGIAVNDAPTGSVTITGTPAQGQTLTASHTLADADGLGPISYQWLANGSAISGATASSYVLTEAEVGQTLSVTASYSDGHGTSESIGSTATAAVANVNDAPTGSVTITGTPAQGQTLTASHTLADADGLGPISYQWLANGSAISGATASSYVLTEAEVGQTLSVTASYSDGHGTSESVGSTATAATAAVANVTTVTTVANVTTVNNVNNAPIVGIATGTATQGQTLTASTAQEQLLAAPPPLINANPLGMPPIFGSMNAIVTSSPVDNHQDTLNNTASADSYDANPLDVIRPGNGNIFDTEIPQRNKSVLSADVITAPRGAVFFESEPHIVTAKWTSEPPPSMVEPPGEIRLANNFNDLLISSKVDYTVDMNRSFTQSEERALWQHIAAMKDQIDDSELRRYSLEIDVVVVATVTLAAGFVRWALRSASLLASLFSSVSLLKRFDPLPIFIADKKSAASAGTESQEQSTDDKAEQLFSRPTRRDNS